MGQVNQLALLGSEPAADGSGICRSEDGGGERLEAVRRCLAAFLFHFTNEKELQQGIETALLGGGFAIRREVHLAVGDVPDFIVAPGVCVEVKIAGGLSALTRQLHRYAQHAEVESILVVTSKATHCGVPALLNGKPVVALLLRGGLR